MKNLLIIFASVFMFVNQSVAQEVATDTTKAKQLYVVVKNDGTEYIGELLSDDGREVLLMTEALGKIYIIKSDIKSITKVEDKKEIVFGEYQSAGPFTTRYAFTTNALPISKGENYALINLYGPEVHFAVSDNFNIGIMSTWMASPMILAMKYSIKTSNEKINVSIGSLMGTSGYLNSFRGFGGLHFANITFGTRKKNLTIAGGFAHLQSGFERRYYEPGTYVFSGDYLYDYSAVPNSDKLTPTVSGPIFSIAGITMVGSKASFVFDSMVGFFMSTRNDITSTVVTDPIPGYYESVPPYAFIPGTPGVFQHVVSDVKTTQMALFLMPGMRFQTKENRAFQVSLAGVSVFRMKGFSANGGQNTFSFPFPMCTWFFKF